MENESQCQGEKSESGFLSCTNYKPLTQLSLIVLKSQKNQWLYLNSARPEKACPDLCGFWHRGEHLLLKEKLFEARFAARELRFWKWGCPLRCHVSWWWGRLLHGKVMTNTTKKFWNCATPVNKFVWMRNTGDGLSTVLDLNIFAQFLRLGNFFTHGKTYWGQICRWRVAVLKARSPS